MKRERGHRNGKPCGEKPSDVFPREKIAERSDQNIKQKLHCERPVRRIDKSAMGKLVNEIGDHRHVGEVPAEILMRGKRHDKREHERNRAQKPKQRKQSDEPASCELGDCLAFTNPLTMKNNCTPKFP